MMRVIVALVIAWSVTAAGCAAPVLRQSVCITPGPGMQVCQFAYEGDPKE